MTAKRRRTATLPTTHEKAVSLLSDRTFALLMARFDAVDKDNSDIKLAVAKHIVEDTKVHDTVSKHSTYWGLLITSLTVSGTGLIAWFTGWLRT